MIDDDSICDAVREAVLPQASDIFILYFGVSRLSFGKNHADSR